MTSGIMGLLVVLFGTQNAIAASAPHYVPGHVIVKYKEGVERSREMMNDFYDEVGVQQVRRFSKTRAGLEMRDFEHLILEDHITVEDAIRELMQSPMVQYAQPNYILSLDPVEGDVYMRDPQQDMPCIPGFEVPGCNPDLPYPCLIPGVPFPPGCTDEDSPTPPPGGGGKPVLQPAPPEVLPPVQDPQVGQLYGMEKIGATRAWDQYAGSKDFVVAVIDTGIDYNHEDLSFNVWRNPNPKEGDVTGYDFIHNDGLPFDDHQHGTHTAGTVGAVGANGVGVSGVAQRVSIMGLKFLSAQGSGTTADAIRAIDYAIEHDARVLSNSWGGKGDEDNKALFDAIERARAKDVLFIAAAGNDGTDNDGGDPSYPAAFNNDNLISVAATDKSDALAYFSNYGKKTTHVAAPGVNIHSTVPGNKYTAHSGTSMACPHVAGAAAMIWSRNPDWSYKKVKEVLLSSVDKVPGLETKIMTGGRINLHKALRNFSSTD